MATEAQANSVRTRYGEELRLRGALAIGVEKRFPGEEGWAVVVHVQSNASITFPTFFLLEEDGNTVRVPTVLERSTGFSIDGK